MYSVKEILLDKINEGAIVPIPLIGISMQPLLLQGDILMVSKSEKYNVDDIVLFYFPKEGYLLHRIVKKDGEKIYYCKGDNAKRIELIMKRQIVGVLLSAYRGGKCVYEKEKQNS